MGQSCGCADEQVTQEKDESDLKRSIIELVSTPHQFDDDQLEKVKKIQAFARGNRVRNLYKENC